MVTMVKGLKWMLQGKGVSGNGPAIGVPQTRLLKLTLPPLQDPETSMMPNWPESGLAVSHGGRCQRRRLPRLLPLG